QEISEYIADRQLGDSLGARIKRHFRFFYFKTSVFDERSVMAYVPWHLCQEVLQSTHAVALRAAGVLQDNSCSDEVILKLARCLMPMELDFREEVCQQGDLILQMYFVVRGRIEAYLDETRTEDRRRWSARSSFRNWSAESGSYPGTGRVGCTGTYLGVWGPGSLWGLNNILMGG
ncbi:unnamed protein product, partial [Choristocarpus tenellus]